MTRSTSVYPHLDEGIISTQRLHIFLSGSGAPTTPVRKITTESGLGLSIAKWGSLTVMTALSTCSPREGVGTRFTILYLATSNRKKREVIWTVL